MNASARYFEGRIILVAQLESKEKEHFSYKMVLTYNFHFYTLRYFKAVCVRDRFWSVRDHTGLKVIDDGLLLLIKTK